jgi:hypothetical protein
MYISAKEAAKKWGISERRVRILCSEEGSTGCSGLPGLGIFPPMPQNPATAGTSGT